MRFSIVTFLARVAGTRTDAAAMTPLGLQGRATIGGLLLTIYAMAICTWGYAAYRLFLGDPFALQAAAVIGLLGGTFVFLVDRSLAMTVDLKAATWTSVAQIGGRVLISAIIAWSMSWPAILRFSREVLATQQMLTRGRLTIDEFQANAIREGLPGERDAVKDIQEQVADADLRLKGKPDTAEYARAQEQLAAATRNEAQVSATNAPRIAAAQGEIDRLTAGGGEPPSPRVAELRRAIRGWRGEIARAASARLAAVGDERRLWRAWIERVSGERAMLHGRLATARERADAAADGVRRRNDASERDIDRQTIPTLAREYTTFMQIAANPSHPDARTLRSWAWAFHLLFFMFEMMPLILKLSWPRGPIDEAVEICALEDTDRIVRANNERTAVANALSEARIALREKALAAQRDAALAGPIADLRKALAALDDLAA